jgi:hypothetical protein
MTGRRRRFLQRELSGVGCGGLAAFRREIPAMSNMSASSSQTEARAGHLKEVVQHELALPEEAIVTIGPLPRGEQECSPGTVISIFTSSGSRRYKLHKALAEITLADIRALEGRASLSVGND